MAKRRLRQSPGLLSSWTVTITYTPSAKIGVVIPERLAGRLAAAIKAEMAVVGYGSNYLSVTLTVTAEDFPHAIIVAAAEVAPRVEALGVADLEVAECHAISSEYLATKTRETPDTLAVTLALPDTRT